ncbi:MULTISPECIES: thioester domain-containing protein [unclassified Arthrobacter]|uniref:thioester domain-containing protein n=1 Tax=unclassified Arthrobacter TaxID=235627 RepID=UPI001E4B6FE2|nr:MULTISPECIES: thioester domain-containing protein [unclassified Arthrobacter]MCC9146871.1 thioester domain-containing protein [Arthrobacter sp. zg-Y919]MDK1278102.1 thioester domain-containing protein [Arthrobacter sp. zg.Y919]WIB03542.1 thioester domain-containing protein [Arthrobacter sp. zg-Y919]
MVGVLLAALLVLALPAQAVFSGTPPGTTNPAADVEVTMTGTAEGTSVAGGLPPAGAGFDISAYPAEVPPGYEDSDASFAGIITTTDADGSTESMYCIDIRTSTYSGLGYEGGTWSESEVPNVGYVNRILNNYYPSVPTAPPAPTADEQAAAVQAAIWFFSDGFVLDAGDPIRDYTVPIIEEAIAAGPLPEPPAPAVAIDPPLAAGPVDGVTGPFTVTTGDGELLTVEVATGFTLYTDPAGTVPLIGPVPSGTQVWVRSTAQTTAPAVVTARAVVPVQTGNVYLYVGNNPDVSDAQRLILAVSTEIESVAEATAEFFVPGDLVVNKTFAGEAVGSQGAIALTVDCGAAGLFSFEIPAGTAAPVSETIVDLPVGTVCSLTEPVTGSTTEVTVTPTVSDPVTITEGENVLAVTNTVEFNPGSLVVAKTISGSGAGLQDDIVLHVQCGDGLVDEIFVIPEGTTADTFTQLYQGIPAGVLCRVSEPASGANEDVTVESTGTAEVTILPGQSQTVEVVNVYAPVPVTERLPRTGADGPTYGVAIAGGGALLAGSLLVLGSTRRRHNSFTRESSQG